MYNYIMLVIEEEIWKDIPDFEGYQASSLGNIRSLNYNKTGKIQNLKLKLGNGYYQVNIKNKWPCVNRLVYSAFYGRIPDGLEVNHIDENKLNNRISNLNLMTRKENANWGTKNKRISEALKKHFNIVQQLNADGEVIAEFNGILDVQAKTGYNNSHISKCCTGKRKRAYGYYWRYK